MLIDDITRNTFKIQRALREIENTVRCQPFCSPSLQIKNPTVLKELVSVPWHEKLIDVISWIHYEFQGCVYITSGFRIETGIHNTNPLRAVDLRDSLFENPKEIANEINYIWDYGKSKYNVCHYHRSATCKDCGNRFDISIELGITDKTKCPDCLSKNLIDNAPHFHIQVRDETTRRKEEFDEIST